MKFHNYIESDYDYTNEDFVFILYTAKLTDKGKLLLEHFIRNEINHDLDNFEKLLGPTSYKNKFDEIKMFIEYSYSLTKLFDKIEDKYRENTFVSNQ